MQAHSENEPRPALLSAEQAGKALSCGRTYIYELMSRGELRSVKVGRLRRIPATEIDRYVAGLLAAQSAAGDAA